MKKRTINYLKRQKAIRDMINFRDLKSFLMAGFQMSSSLVVKRDIIQTIVQLDGNNMQLAQAS